MVVLAPARAARPGAGGGGRTIPPPDQVELTDCPFCEGRESRTPPETLALGRGEGEPDRPGWRIRVVPNLYPAFERQEVVVHAPEHVRSFAELERQQLAQVAEAWGLRTEAAAAEGFPYVHALVNEGREAGASLAHSHSQLVWMREPPPAVVSENVSALPSLLARDDLAVGELGGVRAVVHPAGRVPYETVVAATDPAEGAGGFLPAALALVAEVVRALRAVEGHVPWNAWLHAGDHPHLELLPRLTVFAGIELGAGIYVNTLRPEEAARRLRSAS
jgi:UDPglucose--hexose-1-phosphate uridylyltransferase